MTGTVAGAPIRWGVLGAGAVAATVGADIAASPGSRLAAVAARDPARAEAFAQRHGVARAHASYADLVADPDVDIVYLATTHAQHHEHALLALRAGKPVLVEKAFTLNARQAREIVDAARERALFCMEAMWLRCHPLLRRVADLAAGGAIGDVVGVRSDLSKRFPFDPGGRLFDLGAGGGALLDLGVYPAHFTWMLLGRPDTVQATGSLAPTGSDLTAALQWGYRNGRAAQIWCSAAADSPYAALVTGTAGWIRVETRLHRPSAITVRTADGEQVIPAEPVVGNGYGHEVAEAERCLRAGLTESPLVPLDDTVGVLEVLDESRRPLGARYPADDPADA